MKILFAGTPDFAVPTLRALAQEHQIVGVLCSPDAPSGRGRKETPCAVKIAALELGFPVLQPQRLDAASRELVAPLGAEILVCVAYGFIFGPRFLALFSRGGINLHPSLLPRFRGPSPLSAAILAGDRESGITVQKLAAEMDSGDILVQESFILEDRATTASISEYCANRGAELVLIALEGIAKGNLLGKAQNHAVATFCHLISKEDGRITWSEPATHIDRMVRAYNPWPRAFSSWKQETLYILESQTLPGTLGEPGTVLRVDKQQGILVQTGEGILALRRLQLQSKKALDFQSFLNGARDFIGTALGA